MSDLMIRETILGVLKSKCIDGQSRLHSSDFKLALSNLGIPWGSPVIEDIMIHCKADAQGFIDLTLLEESLQAERVRANHVKSKQIIQSLPSATSSGISSVPLRVDIIHNQKIQKEKQSKIVQSNLSVIRELFMMYAKQELSADNLLIKLQLIGIEPTVSFLEYLKKYKLGESKFSTFLKMLSGFDERPSDVGLNRSAGVPIILDVQREENADNHIFSQRKRNIWKKRLSDDRGSIHVDTEISSYLGMPSSSAFVDIVQNIPIKKDCVNLQNPRIHVPNTEALKSSKNLAEVLFPPQEVDPSLSLFSASQQAMLESGFGINRAAKLTSQNLILREEVMVALRKLDEGKISSQDFLERLYLLGFDIPEVVYQELRTVQTTGEVKLQKFVQLLDSTLFKVMALEEQSSVEDLVNQFRHCVLEEVEGAFVTLAIALRDYHEHFHFHGKTKNTSTVAVDKVLTQKAHLSSTNKYSSSTQELDGFWSLGEFVKVATSLSLSCSIEYLHQLFNALDAQGRGSIGYMTLMNALRGPISPLRRKYIRFAFDRCNSRGLFDYVEAFFVLKLLLLLLLFVVVGLCSRWPISSF